MSRLKKTKILNFKRSVRVAAAALAVICGLVLEIDLLVVEVRATDFAEDVTPFHVLNVVIENWNYLQCVHFVLNFDLSLRAEQCRENKKHFDLIC